MNLSRVFIDRPIAAIVLSAMIVIAGALSLGGLPLTEYPQVTPPTVVVRAAYPGANPTVIAETVAAPLEQEVNGVEGMLRASTLAIGAPSELLRRRPDVAGAEARVQAAAARAGIARAELFPRVEISGAVGLVAGSVGRLTDAASGSWLIAPRLLWNVLDWPRLRRELRAAGALADAAFADYEQTVLVGIEEAETAIDAYAAANRELQAFERRAGASADAANVVFIQYREGFVDSLARTQAERDAIAGALDANRALTAHRLAVVGVYRALGGGWR